MSEIVEQSYLPDSNKVLVALRGYRPWSWLIGIAFVITSLVSLAVGVSLLVYVLTNDFYSADNHVVKLVLWSSLSTIIIFLVPFFIGLKCLKVSSLTRKVERSFSENEFKLLLSAQCGIYKVVCIGYLVHFIFGFVITFSMLIYFLFENYDKFSRLFYG